MIIHWVLNAETCDIYTDNLALTLLSFVTCLFYCVVLWQCASIELSLEKNYMYQLLPY